VTAGLYLATVENTQHNQHLADIVKKEFGKSYGIGDSICAKMQRSASVF
jgi:hypothetical protein